MNLEYIEQELSKRHEEAHKANFNWMRHSLIILTPSLVLLIGLQQSNLYIQPLQLYALLASIVLITLSILLGILALRGEAKIHHAYQEYLISRLEDPTNYKNDVIDEKPFPWWIAYPLTLFPVAVALSILSLKVFGILKYTC